MLAAEKYKSQEPYPRDVAYATSDDPCIKVASSFEPGWTAAPATEVIDLDQRH